MQLRSSIPAVLSIAMLLCSLDALSSEVKRGPHVPAPIMRASTSPTEREVGPIPTVAPPLGGPNPNMVKPMPRSFNGGPSGPSSVVGPIPQSFGAGPSGPSKPQPPQMQKYTVTGTKARTYRPPSRLMVEDCPGGVTIYTSNSNSELVPAKGSQIIPALQAAGFQVEGECRVPSTSSTSSSSAASD